jgi:hypothetical protein
MRSSVEAGRGAQIGKVLGAKGGFDAKMAVFGGKVAILPKNCRTFRTLVAIFLRKDAILLTKIATLLAKDGIFLAKNAILLT